MNQTKNKKKKRIKLNIDAFLIAAESYFDGFDDEHDIIICSGAWSCIRLKLIMRHYFGVDGVDMNSFEREFYENIFGCRITPFKSLWGQVEIVNPTPSPEQLKELRIMALCLAAELARQYNSKKGGSFGLTNRD